MNIMKLTYSKFPFFVFTVLFAFLTEVRAQTYTDSRRIVKTFKVTPSTTVDITNKYGKIHVVPWNKDSVKIEVNLMIKSSSHSKINKIKSNIDFDFTQTNYYIVVSTVFGTKYNTILSDLKNLAETFLTVENQVTIDYTIKMPSWTNLKIENKFGDIFIDDLKGDLDLKLSNGDLKANNLTGSANISINYGDGVINYLKDAKLFISYSDLLLKKADKITLDSKSSKITLNTINVMKTKSRRDKYYITESAKLYGDTYFTDVYITRLEKELSFDLKYGNISIETIPQNFSLINISSEYTDIDLIFQKNTSYQFDLTHNNDIVLNYPRDISNLKEKLVDEEEDQYLVYGNIGGMNTNSKLRITALKKCYIKIIHK